MPIAVVCLINLAHFSHIIISSAGISNICNQHLGKIEWAGKSFSNKSVAQYHFTKGTLCKILKCFRFVFWWGFYLAVDAIRIFQGTGAADCNFVLRLQLCDLFIKQLLLA